MIGLVGCSSQKLDRAAPARDLYTSTLFRKALAYAEARCSIVYVMSALHDLVELDTVVAPYDRRIGGKSERQAWGRRVASKLVARHGRAVDYLILAGSDYADPLSTELRRHDGWQNGAWRGVAPQRLLQPMAGMPVGERLRWLNDQARGAA